MFRKLYSRGSRIYTYFPISTCQSRGRCRWIFPFSDHFGLDLSGNGKAFFQRNVNSLIKIRPFQPVKNGPIKYVINNWLFEYANTYWEKGGKKYTFMTEYNIKRHWSKTIWVILAQWTATMKLLWSRARLSQMIAFIKIRLRWVSGASPQLINSSVFALIWQELMERECAPDRCSNVVFYSIC